MIELNKRSAMVFAAGLGTRMQPLTNSCPKPLLKVAGKTFLQRSLDHITQAQIRKVVVNAFYFPEQVLEALHNHPHIDVSIEKKRLETGGGARNALHLLGPEAFFTLNGDVVWQTPNLLAQLHECWDDDAMDALLLLIPSEKAYGSVGKGDFTIDSSGKLSRYKGRPELPLTYTGCQLIHPRLFEKTPDVFSMNLLFDRALEKGRLYGQMLQGDWYHISTPKDLETWGPVIMEREEERKTGGGRI